MAKKPEPKALATNCQRTRVVDDGKPGKWPSGLDLGMPNTSPGRLLGEVQGGLQAQRHLEAGDGRHRRVPRRVLQRV